MTNYLVHTVLMLGNGAVVSVPVKLFGDREAAGKFAKERQSHLAALLGSHLVVMSGENQAEPTGLTLGQALGELGVSRFATQVSQMEVADQRIALATEIPPNIVLGGRA